jgi:hypothetical protein
MVDDQQGPAWISDLLDEQEQGAVEDAREEAEQADMVEDLREQMLQAEEERGAKEQAPIVRVFMSLAPAQRLLLAVLLFLDVALCGCMALVMFGRVGLPF